MSTTPTIAASTVPGEGSAIEAAPSSQPASDAPPPNVKPLRAIADFEDAGPIPLIIGVTGHCNLARNEIKDLEERVLQLLRELKEKLNHGIPAGQQARLVIMSTLAKGASQLVARVATGPEINARLIVPLATPQQQCENDLHTAESLAEFRRLLARADRVLHLSGGGVAACKCAHGEAHQRLHADIFIAHHCYILLALWDGRHTDACADPSQIVGIKLHNCVCHQPTVDFSVFAIPTVGPVYQIVASNGHVLPESEDKLQIHYSDEAIKDRNKPAPTALGNDVFTLEVIKRLREYHCDWLRLKDRWMAEKQPQEGENDANQADGLIPGADFPRDILFLRQHCSIAGFISAFYKARWNWVMVAYLGLFVIAAFLLNMFTFLPLTAHRPQSAWLPGKAEWWIIVLYSGFIAGIFVCLWLGKSLSLQRKFYEYRALAESLRVQLFWRLADIHARSQPICVADFYLQYQIGELNWVRYAMYTMDLPRLDNPQQPPSSHRPLEMLTQCWIDEQLAFFKKKAPDHNGKLRTFRRWGGIALGLAVGWGLLKMFARMGNRWAAAPSRPAVGPYYPRLHRRRRRHHARHRGRAAWLDPLPRLCAVGQALRHDDPFVCARPGNSSSCLHSTSPTSGPRACSLRSGGRLWPKTPIG